MNSSLKHQLLAEVQKGGQAYVRNLAMAEAAVLNGQAVDAPGNAVGHHNQRA